MKNLVWLAVQPTPYNCFFFKHLKQTSELYTDIYFSLKEYGGLPWKSLTDNKDQYFDRKLGIDWSLVKRAFTDQKSLFVIAGWDDLTKLMVIAIRHFKKYPFAVWTDTVEPFDNSVRYRAKRLVLSNLFKNATALMTTGQVGIDYLKQSGFSHSDSQFVNFPFWVPIPDISQKVFAQNDAVRFLCAGRLVPRKGYDLVIEALRLCHEAGHKNIFLKIAGTGPEESRLHDLVAKYKLEDYVCFLGWLEPEEMNIARIECDVFIHVVPTHDPFPVAVLEAMAAGMAVIGSKNAGSVSERVESGKNGFIVDTGQPDKISQAMLFFAKHPESIAEMSRQARKTAELWAVDRGIEIVKALLNKI